MVNKHKIIIIILFRIQKMKAADSNLYFSNLIMLNENSEGNREVTPPVKKKSTLLHVVSL